MNRRWLVPCALIGACTTALALAGPDTEAPEIKGADKPAAEAPKDTAPGYKASFKAEWNFPGASPTIIGKPAPELDVADWYGGDAMTIAGLKGKIVVVDFWGTWCPPCRKAVPHTTEMAAKYKDKGVQIIGVHSKKLSEKMEATAKQLKMGYPTAKDAHEKSQNAYGVEFWPYYVIIDREGVVRAAGINPQFLGNAIDEMLKEQPAKPAA